MEKIHVDIPHYSDHEEHFEIRGHGGTIRAGSSIERPNVLAHQEFLHKLEERLKILAKKDDYEKVFICAKSRVKNAIWKLLPKILKNKAEIVLTGNLTKSPPLVIIEKICGEIDQKKYKKRPLDPKVSRIIDLARTT